MKKPIKFGARKRYNGEEDSLVNAPTAKRMPLGEGVTKEQTDEAYDNMRRLAKDVSEGRAARVEGERSASEDREKIMGGTRPSSFREAFAEARKAGKDKFTFNGKSYTTEMAGAKPAAPKSAESKPAETKAESASLEVRASRLPPPNKPREASGILSSLKEGVTRGGYEFGQEKETPKRSTSEKKPRSTERPEGFLSSFSKAITSGGREFTGGGHEFGKKHGGKVHKYAAGGKVGSASKRADGIAQRGKTRGMMR